MIAKINDGEIVCISECGHGSNFIFIVSLGEISDNLKESVAFSNRIFNPINKTYEKLNLNNYNNELENP